MNDHVEFTSSLEHAAGREAKHASILAHLQTALEIEYSTVPIYLYTYYSINRIPLTFPAGMSAARVEEIKTFANEAGALLMSVAVEEMLHMSLAANLIRALGGMPDLNLYSKPSTCYPTPLPHHNPSFNPDPDAKGLLKIPLSRFSELQLGYFLAIEYPEKEHATPQGANWDTIGQFYDYIRDRLVKETTDADYGQVDFQLGSGKGYYSPNTIDTLYPNKANWESQPVNWNDPSARGARAAMFTNARDSGGLIAIHDKASALRAIDTICTQGEGSSSDPTHEHDDPRHKEDTHWYKFNQLHEKLKEKAFDAEALATFVHPFPDNPTREMYAHAVGYDYRPFVDLANAVFTYIFQMTQASYELRGAAQHMMFNIGMHKGMIFVLDKIINAMRYYHTDGDGTSGKGGGAALAPSFENYPFKSLATAKAEMVALFSSAPLDFQQSNTNILQRLSDLPDVHVGPGGVIRF